MPTCNPFTTLSDLGWPRAILRRYPAGFGAAIKNLYPRVVTGAEGCPVVESLNGWDVFAALPCSTWDEARLVPSLRYMRGNKSLNLPPEWRNAMPQAMEILHSLEQKRLDRTNQESEGWKHHLYAIGFVGCALEIPQICKWIHYFQLNLQLDPYYWNKIDH
jgi:hypothetical protein